MSANNDEPPGCFAIAWTLVLVVLITYLIYAVGYQIKTDHKRIDALESRVGELEAKRSTPKE